MRKETKTSNGVVELTAPTHHVKTTYSNKIISVELQDQLDHNLINCNFQNGRVNPSEAILERAVNGFDFEKIGSIKKYEDPNFQFKDSQKQAGQNYNYRLLIREKNGVTYYSEIISCNI